MVSWPTAKRWAVRYAELGEAGMGDRSSRPHSCPITTPEKVMKQIVALRWRKRPGPVQIAGRLNCQPRPSTPCTMIHVDVTKFGNIPDSGGHRFVGRQQGTKNRAATPDKPRNAHPNPKMGTAYVHTVIDDNSRVAYPEICNDEKASTAIGVLQRAMAWFVIRGVKVERVLSDNGSAYRSHAWRDARAELDIKHKRTRPYRPQTNGKIERFHRTPGDGWAYARFYDNEEARRAALPAWIHHYNHHKLHTAIGNKAPINRLNNLTG